MTTNRFTAVPLTIRKHLADWWEALPAREKKKLSAIPYTPRYKKKRRKRK